jgi:hypothetical protein
MMGRLGGLDRTAEQLAKEKAAQRNADSGHNLSEARRGSPDGRANQVRLQFCSSNSAAFRQRLMPNPPTHSANTAGQEFSGLRALARLAGYQDVIPYLSSLENQKGHALHSITISRRSVLVNEDLLPLEDLPGKIMLPIRQSYPSSDNGDGHFEQMTVFASHTAHRFCHFQSSVSPNWAWHALLSAACVKCRLGSIPECSIATPLLSGQRSLTT